MERSTSKFAKYFYKLIEEDMTAGGAGSALGPNAGGNFAPNASTSGDTYETDNAVLPFPLFSKGKVLKRADVDPKKKKKKKKKAKKTTKPVFHEEIKES